MIVARTAQIANAPISASAAAFSGLAKTGALALRPAPRRRRAPTAGLATLRPWVEPVISNIDGEVREGIDDGSEKGHPEHRRKVEAHGRRRRVATQARPAEDRFGWHRAREEAAERQSDDRHRGDQRVAQAVSKDNDPLA